MEEIRTNNETIKIEAQVFEFVRSTNSIFNHMKNNYVVLSINKNTNHLIMFEYYPEEIQDTKHLVFRGETTHIESLVRDESNNMLIVKTRNSVYEYRYIDTVYLTKSVQKSAQI